MWASACLPVLRSAWPLALDLPIPVLSSAARLEPGVFGIRKPILLLPEGIERHLTKAQLEAVIAHELCHMRRHDNLTAAFHMAVEALFWFHPLVWWIERRLIEERERACDEEALRVAGDPEVYAAGILNVCKLYVEAPLACVSGVTGADLKGRIEMIMSQRRSENLNWGKKLMLASAGVMVVVAPVLIGFLNAPAIRAQSQSEKRLAFEVVSVKPTTETDPRAFGKTTVSHGRFTIVGAPLLLLIAQAYHVPVQSPRLSGAPEWIFRAQYDIDATAEKGAFPDSLTAAERNARLRAMLQTLLRDRFNLVMRRETKEIPVYAVVVGKSGPRLQKSKTEEKDCAEPDDSGRLDPFMSGSGGTCHVFRGGQGRGIHAQAVTIADVAAFVENWSDRPVVDQTGLTGLYDIESEGWVPLRPRPARDPGSPPSAEDLAMADPTRPTLFTIFDRMGLKMEPKKAPAETYTVEHVERPSGN